jgi:O-antigen/teichoic acid export membrane protein
VTSRATAIARGVAVQVGGRLGGLLVALVTIKISTDYLGLEGFGLLTTTIVFAGLFEAFTELGVADVIVRRVTQGRGNLRPLAGVNLGLSIVLGPAVAVTSAAIGLLVYRDNPQLQLAVAIVSIGLIFTTLATCANPVFQTRVQFGAKASADLVSRLLALGATLAVAHLDLGLLAMAAVQVVHPFTRMVIYLVAADRMQRWATRFDVAESLSLVKESLPLTAMIIVGVLYYRADGLILSVLSDSSQVAVYGLALQIAGNLSVLPQVFAKTSMSTLTERRSDPVAFESAVRVSYRIMLVFLLPVAVLGWPLAAGAIGLVSTPEFVGPGTLTLQLFLISMGIGFLNPLLSAALFAAGRQGFLLRMALVTLAINVGLNLVLVPGSGAAGAAAAAIVAQLAGVVASTLVLYREGVRPPTLPDLARILPALAVSLGAVLLLADAPYLLRVAAGAVLYGSLIIAFRALPVPILMSLFERRRRGEHRMSKAAR